MAPPEVTFTVESHWYKPGRRTVIATSALTLPAEVTVYVSKHGSAHGYFANASLALGGAFSYCDPPALMPLAVGRRATRALADRDVTLHIHDHVVTTASEVVDDEPAAAYDDHRAIHAALAADHADALDAWQQVATELGGTLTTRWPPVIDVPRGFGNTTIALRWSPSLQIGAQAVIEFLADARKAPLWSLEREPRPTPSTVDIAARPFLVLGHIPVARDRLARVVTLADILSIIVRRNITVRCAGVHPDTAVFEAVLDLIGELCGPPSLPYR
jgi:hypothetical protein